MHSESFFVCEKRQYATFTREKTLRFRAILVVPIDLADAEESNWWRCTLFQIALNLILTPPQGFGARRRVPTIDIMEPSPRGRRLIWSLKNFVASAGSRGHLSEHNEGHGRSPSARSSGLRRSRVHLSGDGRCQCKPGGAMQLS